MMIYWANSIADKKFSILQSVLKLQSGVDGRHIVVYPVYPKSGSAKHRARSQDFLFAFDALALFGWVIT
ncbi:MAG: hypothetical protein ACI9BD_001468 [Candidatus Marinamargulisbacteria bacterium]|jgi:hypothetical protein